MIVDKALANFCISSEIRRGGDTGRGRVEHRSFLKLRFTHHIRTGQRKDEKGVHSPRTFVLR